MISKDIHCHVAFEKSPYQRFPAKSSDRTRNTFIDCFLVKKREGFLELQESASGATVAMRGGGGGEKRCCWDEKTLRVWGLIRICCSFREFVRSFYCCLLSFGVWDTVYFSAVPKVLWTGEIDVGLHFEGWNVFL